MAMSMRITERSLATTSLAGLQGNLSRMSGIQERLSSGKQLARPSDSPVDTVAAMGLRNETRALQQYGRNADDGMGWLSMADTALASATSQVTRVRDLALQGMSAGAAAAPESRLAIASEISTIRDGLINLANTRYLDRPIFGGTTAGSTAYDSSGTYVGDTGTVTRTVGDTAKVRVDTGGPETFGTGPGQLFAILADIADHMRGDTTALSADLSRLDTASGLLIQKAGDVGARYNRVSKMRQVADDRMLDLKTQLSNIEDIDLPHTIVELQLQQVAYQAALSATAKAIQPSLVDFLR